MQFIKSRHGAPAWAAVRGKQDFTPEQIEFAETYHKGAVNRVANQLALKEGQSAIDVGCLACHDIGKPNPDGSTFSVSCTRARARNMRAVPHGT